MQNQLDEVIKKKKEKYHELKNSVSANIDPRATNNNKFGEVQEKYPDGTTVIIGGSI